MIILVLMYYYPRSVSTLQRVKIAFSLDDTEKNSLQMLFNDLLMRLLLIVHAILHPFVLVKMMPALHDSHSFFIQPLLKICAL